MFFKRHVLSPELACLERLVFLLGPITLLEIYYLVLWFLEHYSRHSSKTEPEEVSASKLVSTTAKEIHS